MKKKIKKLLILYGSATNASGRVSLSLSEGVLFAGGIIQITLLDALVALPYKINNFLIFFFITTTLSPPLDGGVAIH